MPEEENLNSKEATENSESQPQEEIKKVEEQSALPPTHVDYIRQSKPELVESLRLLLSQRTIPEITSDVENIRSIFYKKHNLGIDQKKKNFVDEGGNSDEFELPDDPVEDELKALYNDYRTRKSEYAKMMESEKTDNLQKKLDIIEAIKNLINTQESLNNTFNDFRELQREWREIGPVPQSNLHSLWENYHLQVEMFYDYIKINKELRDLDLRKNLESKIQLCEKAEELLLEPSVVRAFNDLQLLHSEWREVGPVPHEKRDELWDRFRDATNQINKKHQEFYQNLKDEQRKNLEAKTHLCEKIEEILAKEIRSPKQWNELSKEVINLQKMWRSIGFAPRKDNNRIYDRFRKACDTFFNNKREFFSNHREEQNQNLQMKMDLCVQAEALMNSEEWKKTTEELIVIQRKWKQIGPIPRKYSDSLWKRFRTACDTFFKRRGEQSTMEDSSQVDNLKRKQELIEQVKSMEISEDQNKNLNALKKIQKEFTGIGHVPIAKKDEIQKEFRNAIHEAFDQLDLDDSSKELLKYRQKLDNLAKSPNGRSRISSEREKLVNKLKQMESDIILWENNIGFFSKSKKSESLIKEVNHKIEQSRERIEMIKEKLDLLDKHNY